MSDNDKTIDDEQQHLLDAMRASRASTEAAVRLLAQIAQTPGEFKDAAAQVLAEWHLALLMNSPRPKSQVSDALILLREETRRQREREARTSEV